jgi:hypothetical protein
LKHLIHDGRDEYAELFAASGLKLLKVHPTKGPMSVVEPARS